MGILYLGKGSEDLARWCAFSSRDMDFLPVQTAMRCEVVEEDGVLDCFEQQALLRKAGPREEQRPKGKSGATRGAALLLSRDQKQRCSKIQMRCRMRTGEQEVGVSGWTCGDRASHALLSWRARAEVEWPRPLVFDKWSHPRSQGYIPLFGWTRPPDSKPNTSIFGIDPSCLIPLSKHILSIYDGAQMCKMPNKCCAVFYVIFFRLKWNVKTVSM